jgi:hypothetical protein
MAGSTAQEPLDQETILLDYSEGPDALAEAVEGLKQAQLDASPGGGWSIRQLAHHIADGDDLWKMAIKAALGDSPQPFSLRWYWLWEQAQWADRWLYDQRALAPSLDLFRANRTQILDLLARIPGAWERTLQVEKAEGGVAQITVGEIVASQARHALGHIEQISQMRQSL